MTLSIHAFPEYVTSLSNEFPGYDTIVLDTNHVIVIDDQGIGIYKDMYSFEGAGEPIAFVKTYDEK